MTDIYIMKAKREYERETNVVRAHNSMRQKYYIATTSPTYCDLCSGAIWTMLQSWYMCGDKKIQQRILKTD